MDHMSDRIELERKMLEFRNTGIYRESAENFRFSYHEASYAMAVKKLDDIIKKNFEGRDEKNYNNPMNILTFVGGRGSGKTSVMMSFMDALKSYNRNRPMPDPFRNFADGRDVFFTCLDCIDGALLEKGENIFNIVLAQIYERYTELENEGGLSSRDGSTFHKRDMLKLLESVYRTVCEIEALDKSTYVPATASVSYLNALDSLASSQKVKKDFQKLVQAFADMLIYGNSDWNARRMEHYLVIAVDDIDLNVKNGFDMLEKIHRYLMVRNVIVLVSVDYEQILRLTVRHFFDILPPVDTALKSGLKAAHKLAVEYLDKVLPINYRIHMSDINDRHVDEMTSIQHENAGLKQAFLGKIYRRTGICFDSQGLKKHFYQPDSMRQINNFYLLLDNMSHVAVQTLYKGLVEQERKAIAPDIIETLEENFRLMLQDLLQRMTVDKLELLDDAKGLMDSILNMDVRRAKNAVIHFYNTIRLDEKQYVNLNEKQYVNLNKKQHITEDATTDFSYGDLVEAIYDLGRIKNNMYKPFVHCLLAYFSFAFTREYLFEMLKVMYKGSNTRVVKDGRMQELIGCSILEDWGKWLLPGGLGVREARQDAGEETNRQQHGGREVFLFENREVFLLRVFKTNLTDLRLKNIDDVARVIADVEVLYCLFTDLRSPYYTSEELINHVSVEYTREKNGSRTLQIKWQGDSDGKFSILNFIPNAFGMTPRLKALEEELVKQMANVCKDFLEYTHYNDAEIESLLEEKLKDYSIYQKYRHWEADYGENALPFPLQWFDLSYNVLKRTRRHAENNYPVLVQEESVLYSYIQKTYECIADQLDLQKKFYDYDPGSQTDVGPKYQYDFNRQFRSSPVVEYFTQWPFEDYLAGLDLSRFPEQLSEKMLEVMEMKKITVEDARVHAQRYKFWEMFFQRIRLEEEK